MRKGSQAKIRIATSITTGAARLFDLLPRRVYRAGQGPWALAPPFESPAILGRRLYSLIIRAVVITTMAFAVAFGFLSGATSPSAHYDPYTFAIGVSSLFGAACGAMRILSPASVR